LWRYKPPPHEPHINKGINDALHEPAKSYFFNNLLMVFRATNL
jgi:hypothetical protein